MEHMFSRKLYSLHLEVLTSAEQVTTTKPHHERKGMMKHPGLIPSVAALHVQKLGQLHYGGRTSVRMMSSRQVIGFERLLRLVPSLVLVKPLFP